MIVESNFEVTGDINIVKIVISVLTAFEIVFILQFYSNKVNLNKFKNDIARQNSKIKLFKHFLVGLFRSKYWKGLTLDLLLHLFICFPGLDLKFSMR